LKSCVNFRITKDRWLEVRNGMTEEVATTNLLTLWMPKDGEYGLFVDGTTLKRLNSDLTLTTLSTVSSLNMAFAEHNKKVFMGNTVNMLKYENEAIGQWANTDQSSSLVELDDTSYTGEFETPRKIYRGLPLSDVILSYYARMYAAWDRFVFFSESSYPERWRKSAHLVAPEEVTALSCDDNCLYVHTLNWTIPFIGRDPDDFIQMEPKNIGAIKHYPCIPEAVKNQPIWMSRKGWATAQGGQVQRLDAEHFRLDLSDTSKAYTGFDPINKELICSIRT
jgi:hypothetical protein